MALFESAWALALAGLFCGVLMGAVARYAHFCTLNALELHWYAGDSRGLRAWVLAATVAMLATQFMLATNIAPAHDNFYLGTHLNLAGSIIGGLLFGFGMALVGTCGFGALVRIGGGSLRALIVVCAIGISALIMQRGILSIVRLQIQSISSIDFTWAGTQSVGDIASAITKLPVNGLVVIGCALAALYWVFRSVEFRQSRRHLWSAVSIGLAVAFGWWVTAKFQATLFTPVQLESASFVMPNGELLMQLIANTGSVPDYGVGLVVGVVLGAAVVATLNKDLRWEACDSAPELARHLIGAIFMGTGGVLAAGCTIGQGVTAMSMMALSAPIVFACILLGARFGLTYILGGIPALYSWGK